MLIFICWGSWFCWYRLSVILGAFLFFLYPHFFCLNVGSYCYSAICVGFYVFFSMKHALLPYVSLYVFLDMMPVTWWDEKEWRIRDEIETREMRTRLRIEKAERDAEEARIAEEERRRPPSPPLPPFQIVPFSPYIIYWDAKFFRFRRAYHGCSPPPSPPPKPVSTGMINTKKEKQLREKAKRRDPPTPVQALLDRLEVKCRDGAGVARPKYCVDVYGSCRPG